MAALTQHLPHSALAGRRFGSFAGKTGTAGSAHPVGRLTQALAHGPLTTRRYGSFASKAGTAAGGTWDFACPMPLELSGTLAYAADFEFVPALVFATDGLTLTGTLSFAADFEYTSAPNLYLPTASRVELRAIAAGSGTNVEVDFISLVGDTGTLISVEVTCSVFSGTDADAASRLASSATISRSRVTQPMLAGLPGVIYQLVFVGLDAQGDYHTLVGLLAVLSS